MNDDLIERQIANEVALQTDTSFLTTLGAATKELTANGVPKPIVDRIEFFAYQVGLYCYAKGAFDLRREIERATVGLLPQ
jgi:hypothetical protein